MDGKSHNDGFVNSGGNINTTLFIVFIVILSALLFSGCSSNGSGDTINSRVYGHVHVNDSDLFVPNAGINITCNNESVTGFSDESGYYIVRVPCAPGSKVDVYVYSLPLEICPGPFTCTFFKGGEGHSEGILSEAGYVRVDVSLS